MNYDIIEKERMDARRRGWILSNIEGEPESDSDIPFSITQREEGQFPCWETSKAETMYCIVAHPKSVIRGLTVRLDGEIYLTKPDSYEGNPIVGMTGYIPMEYVPEILPRAEEQEP